MEEKKRFLLVSDVHLCQHNWYGPTSRERLERLIADLRAEHGRSPLTAIFLLGDYSLDYWLYPPYGSYAMRGESNTEAFVREFLPRFPCETHLIPGNHEQYSHRDWLRITGCERQYYTEAGGCLFFMLDNYARNLASPVNNDGTYTPTDFGFIRDVLATVPEKPAFLCAHSFEEDRESPEFAALLESEPRIRALFAGHNHLSRVEKCFSKPLLRTGNYSYSDEEDPMDSFWGFRELTVGADGISSAYLTHDAEAEISGERRRHAATRQDVWTAD